MPAYEEQDSAEHVSTRTVAIMKLRLGFTLHGFDVSAYADDQVSAAIGAEAIASADASRDLFTRAFERLNKNRLRAT